MKTLLFFLLSLTAQADVPSTHGMLVFGKDKIYVSHLPMFHAPHDYQLIAELELPPAALDAYRASLAAHPGELIYTLVPERLDLTELVARPHAFHAELYRGHFERGGTVIAAGLTVKLGNLLAWKKFVPGEKKPADASYLLFGKDGEAFLAHRITDRPNFDQILSVGQVGVLAGSAVDLTIPGHDDATPLHAPSLLSARRADGAVVTVAPLQEIYLETGDLQ
jgi:hypothetical protein